MGSRIAAHIANAGLPVVLLDIVPPGTAPGAPKSDRNRIVLAALEGLKKSKPAAFYTPESARLITPGNFDDDLGLIADCDWILEVVAENLDIKRALLEKLRRHRRPGVITTTNTSGLPVHEIVASLDDADLRSHWFGTHFFNPPRYMLLLELIPTPETDPADIAAITHFCDRRLGKTVVLSRDTPNFLANRIGTFSMGNAIRLMMQQGLTIEEVDALTGAPLGWPRTGTFRLGDLVGVDVMAHVARNFEGQASRIHDERTDVTLAPFITQMLEKQLLGDKVGSGFYKKTGRDEQGRDLRHVLDWQSLDYKPSTRPRLPALEMAKNIEQTSARIAQLLHGDPEKDKAARFYWPLLTELFTYAANRVSSSTNEPAATIVEIDEAMKTGFNWELGPFEMMDAAGPRATTEKMQAAGLPVASNVLKLLASGADPDPTWYRDDPSTPSGRQFFDVTSGSYKPVPAAPGTATLSTLKKSRGVVKRNAGASLIDLGNGVAAIELHSKMNALGGDIVSLITQTLKPTSEAVRDFEAFVITGDSTNFSVGANLMQLLLSVQEEEWDEVEMAVRQFQNMTQAIKFCPRPVVVAPYGMCLGGGVEIALHAAARQPHAELYMGLVEAGVGLIPGGGGCKEMTLRSIEAGSSIRPDARGEGVEIFEALKKNFETIAKATVSTSAAEARQLGFLKPSDRITLNRLRLLTDAGTRARQIADANYTAPTPRTDIPAPGESVLATLKLAVWTLREGAFISDHDAKVANGAAHILCGGKLAPGTPVSEQYLLDLEREAFLSLCGEKKTQERIAFTLKTGKPLRN
ncbi:MAG: 3-hydroxyacyl-CoA dehydrogenase/enoyl-CoA hydratase family protein [Acidobacteriaceae bacterium]